MICAICHYLARGQEVREAITVVAGYAACEPHFAIAEVAGKDGEGVGLAALEATLTPTAASAGGSWERSWARSPRGRNRGRCASPARAPSHSSRSRP